ncbi:MAG: hypothetical protein V1748_08080 [Actinomycetota bacterium]
MSMRTRIDGKSVVVTVLVLVALAAGWLVMARQIHERTGRAVTEGRAAAAEIWGASVSQESPLVSMAGNPQGTLPLSSASGKVDLTMDYRKRGLVYLTGFRATFDVNYAFRNSTAATVPVDFHLPLPAGGELFTALDLKGTIPGAETSYFDASGIHWSGVLGPGQVKTLEAIYETRGLDNYVYHLPRSQALEVFDLTVTVDRGGNIDYPLSTTAPTSKTTLGKKTTMTWDFNNVISGFDVGVTLPEHPDYAKDLVRLNLLGPALLIGMLALLWLMLYLKGWEPDLGSVCLTALAFFLVFPLASYLVSFMGIVPAYAIAASVGGAVILFFMTRTLGAGSLPVSILALALFLGVFPFAIMADRYTGLVITAGLFVLVVASMELYRSWKPYTTPEDALEGAAR